ncbi:MAG: MobA/MobL family protein [Gammaproteobacteria bacterium]
MTGSAKMIVMAIYHLNIKPVSKGGGKNIIAVAAYCRGVPMYSEQEGEWKDPREESNKPEVLHSELSVPDNAPDWVQELVDLEAAEKHAGASHMWNQVDAQEKRSDARFAREIEIALPIEMTLEENIVALREFVETACTSKGMIVDWSIHWKDGNPHAHLLLTKREITSEGFGQVVEAWNARSETVRYREQWADVANRHLMECGHAVRIDHRSYADQGIDLIPTKHLGPAVIQMAERGIETERFKEFKETQKLNRARVEADPHILFDALSKQKDAFSEKDVKSHLDRYTDVDDPKSAEAMTQKVLRALEAREAVFTDRQLIYAITEVSDDPEKTASLLNHIQYSRDVIALGPGEDGRERYTTRRLFVLENRLQQLGDQLRDRRHTRISLKKVNATLVRYEEVLNSKNTTEKKIGLTPEQREFVEHLTRGGSLVCGVGRAGTGKSFSLGAAREVWAQAGLQVQGIALAGIAAEGLQESSDIPSRTIASWERSLQEGALKLTEKDVIVLDEAGMVDSPTLVRILDAVRSASAKLVLIGDHAQLQPIGPGAAFRALLERTGFKELMEIYRQGTPWQRKATSHFAAGETAQALEAYHRHGDIQYAENADSAKKQLVQEWMEHRRTTGQALSDILVIAHRREEVSALNALLRDERITAGELEAGIKVNMADGRAEISIGDRLLFLENSYMIGVRNGQFGTVKEFIYNEKQVLTGIHVIVDGKAERHVTIPVNRYKAFAHGYVATVHKVQGMTKETIWSYIGSSGWDRCLAYVAGTRHRNIYRMIVDQSVYKDLASLKLGLGRFAIKDSVLDFPYAFALRRGILIADAILKRLQGKWGEKLAQWVEQLTERYDSLIKGNPELYLDPNVVEIKARRVDAKSVSHYAEASQTMGKAWAAVQAEAISVGLGAIDFRSQRWELVEKSAAYTTFRDASAERDRLASFIMQDPERYKTALSYYPRITLEKLQQQANTHQRRELVQQYLKANQLHKNVWRDRYAAMIMQDIKGYTQAVKFSGIEWKTLRDHAQRHQARHWLMTRTIEERIAFREVEHYLKLARWVGQEMRAVSSLSDNKEVISRRKWINLQAQQQSRNEIASQIIKNSKTQAKLYKEIFKFFEIGELSTPREGKWQTEAEKYAHQRLDSLEKYAKQAQARARIEDYTVALQRGDKNLSQQLAAEIIQEARSHHGYVIAMTQDVSALWKAIRTDARAADIQALCSLLSPAEQEGFKRVMAYADARKQLSQAWQEKFAANQAVAFEMEVAEKLVMPLIQEYEALKQNLAVAIHAHPRLHKAGMDYFKVTSEELDRVTHQAACQRRVQDYLQGSKEVKQKLASSIVNDAKGHFAALQKAGIEFKSLYKEVNQAERRLLFASLIPEAKKIIREIEKYHKFNRLSGKYWSHVFSLKEKGAAVPPYSQRRAERVSSYRDAAAYRVQQQLNLLNVCAEFNDMRTGIFPALEWIEKRGRLNQEKLHAQAEKHRNRAEHVESVKNELAEVYQALSSIASRYDANRLNESIEYWLEEHSQARALFEPIKTIMNPIEKGHHRYEAAIQSLNGKDKTLIATYKKIEKLYQHIQTWKNSYQQQASSKKWTNEEELRTKRARAQKVAAQSRPIQNTLAERYLREHRGITGKLATDLRFHPYLYNAELKRTLPALLVLGRDSQGDIQMAQAIFLDENTANKARLHNAKISYGDKSSIGWGVCVQKGQDQKRIIVAEGPETALSIAMAFPKATVYTTCGCQQLGKVTLSPETREVIIAGDHDGQHSASMKTYEKVKMELAARGVDVFFTMPEKLKDDFNDVLLKEGVEQIKSAFQKTTLIQEAITPEQLHAKAGVIIEKVDNISAHEESQNINSEKETSKPFELSLKDVLKEYAVFQIKREQLTLELQHTHALASEEITKEAKNERLETIRQRLDKHELKKDEFLQKVEKLEIVGRAFSSIPAHDIVTVAEQGGFGQIQARLLQGTDTMNDQNAILRHLRSNIPVRGLGQSHEQNNETGWSR